MSAIVAMNENRIIGDGQKSALAYYLEDLKKIKDL